MFKIFTIGTFRYVFKATLFSDQYSFKKALLTYCTFSYYYL